MNLVEAMKYSIWWEPEAELRAELQAAVDRLGQEFGAKKYEAESFVPHITLVPEIVTGNLRLLVKNFDEFAKSLNESVKFELVEITKGNSFFQCVYIKATLNDLMLKTVERGRERFRPELLNQRFLPHLSLLYGDFPKEIRDRAVTRAKNLIRLPQVFAGDRISLWTSGAPAREWQQVTDYKIGK